MARTGFTSTKATTSVEQRLAGIRALSGHVTSGIRYMREIVIASHFVAALLLVASCRNTNEAPPPPSSSPSVVDAVPVDGRAVPADAAMPVDAAPIDAGAPVVDAAVPVRKKVLTKSKRQRCLEKCRRREMNTDCAGDEGMVPCPCHCP